MSSNVDRAKPNDNRFVRGLALSQRFFEEAVRPILAREFSQLSYAAALIGPGSEVLGFDTPISTDNHWGPRVMLLLAEGDHAALQAAVNEQLSASLPYSFMGYPTNYGPPDEIGVRLLQPIESGPIAHRVELTAVPDWFAWYLGWDTRDQPTTRQWLTFQFHRLRAVTTGAVFQDDTGELTAARATLAWYPDDIWYYLLAAQWQRISEEEAFMARCGDVGDELGSTLVAARLVKDIMRLCFLLERQYTPYAKWFGSAFRQLASGSTLEPILLNAIRATTWQERQQALATAFEHVAAAHNALDITDPLDPSVRLYFGRPYLVIGADRFAAAVGARIGDDEIRRLPRTFGALDQLIASTDALEPEINRQRLARIFD